MSALQNVIIIEKQDFLRNMVELCLEEDGIEVIGLKDASDFEYLLKDISPELFLIDVSSVGEYLTQIKQSHQNYVTTKSRTLFVFLGVKQEIEFLQRNSIDAPFLEKPLSPNGLRERLENLLDQNGK